MNKKVAIVICNYNKKEYILKCIKSVKDLNFNDYGIYVVDNASTDGSVEVIRNNFGKEVNLIVNEENTGGSGGFNTGIREVLKEDYKYIYLLDNDVILDSEALSQLYNYMEANQEVAMAGSLLYSMDNSDEIQELGSNIDWDRFHVKPNYKGYIDNGQIPDVIECDYVPACSVLVRREVIDEVGIMDEGNFIYWDDIEWAYRMKQACYKIVSYNKSKVWHKMGVSRRSNTFGTYYFWRNRMHFFTKYLAKEEVREFAEQIFDEAFQAAYSCNYSGKYSSAKTIIAAIEDACANIRGKSHESKVFEIEDIKDRLTDIIKDKDNILLIDSENIKILRNIINQMRSINDNIKITIAAKENKAEELKRQFKCTVVDYSTINYEDYSLIVKACFHIFDIRNNFDDRIDLYIDRFMNIINSKEDREYVNNYDSTYQMLKNIYYPLFVDKLFNLKEQL